MASPIQYNRKAMEAKASIAKRQSFMNTMRRIATRHRPWYYRLWDWLNTPLW